MSYNPKHPESIFEGDNLAEFAAGLANAYRLRHGIDGGEPRREDVCTSMRALMDAEESLKDIHHDK